MSTIARSKRSTMLRTSIGVAAIALTAFVAQATPAQAATPKKSPGFTIDGSGVRADGTGCPAGTVQALVSPDQKTLTVAFSAYTAATGPSSKVTDHRKACTTTVPVRIPAGYTWGITTATYRGYAELHDKAKAYEGATYFFQGSSTGRVQRQVTPDANGNWEVKNKIATVAWAPCKTQSNLIITSFLRVEQTTGNPRTDSFVTMDTQDISLHSKNRDAMAFGLEFKRCN